MNPEARQALQAYVASQKTAHGYMNAGGAEDAYYKQFGTVLEAVFSPIRLFHTDIRLTVPESRGQDTVYGRFFAFLTGELNPLSPDSALRFSRDMPIMPPFNQTTTGACCVLSMQWQTGKPLDHARVDWLRQRQDTSGGFYANQQAPIPDLLSTAAALFTLRLTGVEAKDATQFVQAHWLERGGFAPTLYDNYTDVEYVFYGLLALGSSGK